jgi:hypothetical protein
MTCDTGEVTTWLAEGKNPVNVKEAVGHHALATTMGYTHLAREHLKALVTPNEQSSNKVSGVVVSETGTDNR